MKYETFESDTYNLYTIKCDKFKSCHMEIVFRSKCTKENITYEALLFDMLMENNRDYPSKKLFARKCQELYNLGLYSSTSRVGNTLITSVISDFLDPKYMDDKSLEEIIKLAFSTIFNPNVDCNQFDENTFNIVKKRLYTEIDAIKEDPKQSSILSSLQALDPNSPRGWNTSGDTATLDDITPKKLYNYYKNVLENSYVDVYLIGNLDMPYMNKLINKYTKFTSIKTDKLELYLDDLNIKKTINKSATSNNSQTDLVSIYSTNNLDDYERDYVMPIFNMLWGSGSLDSKLYKSLRSENALCYSVGTYYQKYDKIIILHTEIEHDSYNKALKLIKNTLSEIATGKILESELENAKKILINSLNLIYDSPSRLIDNYLFKNIAGLDEIDKRVDEFKKVTIGDIVKVSKKIKLVENYKVGE